MKNFLGKIKSAPLLTCDQAISERAFYYCILVILCIIYLTAGFALPYLGQKGIYIQNLLFGFSQFCYFKTNLTFTFIMLALIVAAIFVQRFFLFAERHILIPSSQIPVMLRIGISLLAVGVFFALRNNYINPDGMGFTNWFMRYVSLEGAFVSHDELWEFYVHSRFWFYTNQYLGWSVNLSYQVLSCLAGGIFVFLLLSYCPRISPNKPLSAFLLCIAGGYMQLFFGDVENYTLTTAWLMSYFLASALFLEKKVSIILPSILLAISMTFHLLSSVLVPSLMFLYIIAWKRGDKSLLFYAAASFSLVIVLTLIFFNSHGAPIKYILQSHAFEALSNIARHSPDYYFKIPGYYFKIANLSFLLVPAWVLILPIFLYKRFLLDITNQHLLISACCMTIFVLGIKSQLGVYQDWNLFAPAALPVSLLVWRNILHINSSQLSESLISIFGWLFFIHSISWIVANHLR